MSTQHPRRKPDNDYGIILGPVGLILFAVALLGFWPAMVWHGYGGPTGTGWRWDIHSTIAEAVWFGVIGFIAWMCWLGNRPPKAARPKRERSWPPPKYVPPRPGPDPAVTMRLLDGLNAIDAYAAEAEKARTGEELDYLNTYGRLPGRKRSPR